MSETKTTPRKTTRKAAPKKMQAKAVEQPVVEQTPPPLEVKIEQPVNTWEIKDRFYFLKNGLSPLTFRLRCSNIFYFDEDKGYERELLYTRNQQTVFVDEMQGQKRMEHVVFQNGGLFVPKNQQTLQKLLSLYHPYKDKLYTERDSSAEAKIEVDNIELQLEAMNIASTLDIDTAEAVMRAEVGSSVSKMSTKELKRDLLVFARNSPDLFIELAQDENILLRNIAIKSVENKIVTLSPDNRYFAWASTGRTLMTVPFDTHPYTALAKWFKTDEGMEVLKQLEQRLN